MGLADIHDRPHYSSGLEEMGIHTYYYEQVCPFWSHIRELTAGIKPQQLVLLDVGFIIDNNDPPYQGEKTVVFYEKHHSWG